MNQQVKYLINNMLQAVTFERQAEREKHTEEIKRMTGQEREEKGRALIGLRSRRVGRTISGEWLYLFTKADHQMPDTQIGVGDQVIISQLNPLDKHNPTGLVYEMSRKGITIATGSQLKMSHQRPTRLDLFVNDTTFLRMEEALLQTKSNTYSRLQALLSGEYACNSNPVGYQHPSLNALQNNAVDFALGNNGFYSIQGPPGTGKTHTASRLVHEMVKCGHRILITADSNAAVDHLVRQLVALGESLLRIGNPIRVNEDLKSHTMDYKILHHVLFGDVVKLHDEIESVKAEQKDLYKPTTSETKGLQAQELAALLNTKHGDKGISKTALKAMKPWIKSQVKLDGLFDRVKELRSIIQSELLASHRIIASTNSTAGCDLLKDEKFDWSVIDEAAQASIPSTLIALLKAQRFVLVGDHFQLPPVIISQDAKGLGMGQSLMDYLAGFYPYQMMRLNVQYRMHQKISDLVSEMTYGGSLVADLSVAKRTLPLKGPVIEVKAVEGLEHIHADSKSYYNPLEIEAVVKQVTSFLSRGIQPDQIAVISPYKAQTTRIRQALETSIEVDTVDAFQGREKDIVIISFVRSNQEGRLGFLTDFRRLNVSISRAKMKLVLIGNVKLLKSETLYRRLFEWIHFLESE